MERSTMKHADTVLFEVREHIAYITLNRPERYNATRHLEYDLLVDMVKECDRNADVRAVILSGNGKHFSVADDLDGIKVEGYESKGEPLFQHWIDKTWADWVVEGEQINPFHEMVRTIMGSGKIYIAAVHGLCYLSQIIHPFDFVIAADNAMFSEPDILIGQPPCGGGTVRLPRILGRRRTLEILLNPAPFSAQEAYRLGVVNKVVPLADLMAEAEALARKLIVYNPKTISLIKKLVTHAQGTVEEDLKREQMYGGFSHGLPGTGIPTGDWVTLLGYPQELLPRTDTDVRYMEKTTSK
jgi:enoyl-CoA hydratase/carnithine racemase